MSQRKNVAAKKNFRGEEKMSRRKKISRDDFKMFKNFSTETESPATLELELEFAAKSQQSLHFQRSIVRCTFKGMTWFRFSTIVDVAEKSKFGKADLQDRLI
jgi:hypothetical protein